MDWVEPLVNRTVAIDTAPLIAFMAREGPYIGLGRPLFQAIDRGALRAVTSTVPLIEVLVHPLREKDAALASQYKEILMHSANLATVPVSEELALQAAEMRAAHNLRTPDAIQIATALVSGATIFITNDKRLRVPAPLTPIILDDLLAQSQQS